MQAELRDAKWKYAFDRICCIGDSLTSGAYYAGTWGGASIAQNYPNILSRMLNTTVKNSGRSGASAKTWYTNNMAGLTLSDYGTFVIWLGTNQGLTDTIATDVDPYDDYNDFADTHTGYLCRTICQIKEAVPDAHIMICTVFSTSGDLATTNDVINQVASKYALQLVDNSDLDNTNYPLYHSNAVHFNKAGNIFIADRIKNAMISYVAPDGRNAEFGLTARID
jgi:lysophospholipase L1-like esterase